MDFHGEFMDGDAAQPAALAKDCVPSRHRDQSARPWENDAYSGNLSARSQALAG